MYRLIYTIKIKEQILLQEILINDSIVIIFFNNKKSIYIKKNNGLYLVDSENQMLSLINTSSFQKHNEILSKKIGFISNEKESRQEYIYGYLSQLYNCRNNDSSFNCKIKTICVPDFEFTSYNSYYNFAIGNQLVGIPLSKNEVLAYNKTEINLNEIKQIVETELTIIEKIKIQNDLLKIVDYKITSNE